MKNRRWLRKDEIDNMFPSPSGICKGERRSWLPQAMSEACEQGRTIFKTGLIQHIRVSLKPVHTCSSTASLTLLLAESSASPIKSYTGRVAEALVVELGKDCKYNRAHPQVPNCEEAHQYLVEIMDEEATRLVWSNQRA
eukprot:2470153-Alexandrium_andersonii.AAC.1